MQRSASTSGRAYRGPNLDLATSETANDFAEGDTLDLAARVQRKFFQLHTMLDNGLDGFIRQFDTAFQFQ